ncbi:MAG: hypothetical protein K5945_09325 [Bacteroidaceae bacterium]|nr:hypothetical protein [Bacteroidaceae bacterium]
MKSNESLELEELRQQMAILKQKLQQQEILNERMTIKAKEALQKDVDMITRGAKFACFMAIVLAISLYFLEVKRLGFSIPFWIFSSLYMPLRLLYHHWDRNKLCQKDLFEDNLVEAQKNLLIANNHFTKWFKYDLILNIIFPIWLIWEIYLKFNTTGPQFNYVALIVIALPLGFLLFLWSYYSRKRLFREALDKIAELVDEDEAVDNLQPNNLQPNNQPPHNLPPHNLPPHKTVACES